MTKIDLLQGTLDMLIRRVRGRATWAQTDNNRQAKYYSLTRAGRKQLEAEQQNWDRLSAITAEVRQKA